MSANISDITNPKDLQFFESYDHYTLSNPHAGDPRCLQSNAWTYCKLRYTLYCRCCRELGEDDPRCKYQYYRTEIACTQDFLDVVNKHREQGTCSMDTLPSHQLNFCKKKFRIPKFDSCDWHIPTQALQDEIVDLFKCILDDVHWNDLKNYFIFGINDTTESIELGTKISSVILFKGNAPVNIIQHLPYACEVNNIKYVTILKRVNLGDKIPTKCISCVAVVNCAGNDKISNLNDTISRHF